MTRALGLAPHTGWALAVVVEGRAVLDRCRIDFVPAAVDRQVFHAVEGRSDAGAVVEAAVASVADAARRAIARFDVAAAGIVGMPRELPGVEDILRNHRLMHAAEGELYRAALDDACVERGWPVLHALARDLEAEAEGWKGAAGTPWTKEHRLAAAIALRSGS